MENKMDNEMKKRVADFIMELDELSKKHGICFNSSNNIQLYEMPHDIKPIASIYYSGDGQYSVNNYY